MNVLNIILNGKNVAGNEGESILSLATRHGYSIPTLCHEPRLEPFSSCFVCVVEVKGMRGFQPSCSTKISEGMEVDTESAEVRKARKTALDLLLSNHYADCLGPCKLTCPAGVDVQGYISLIDKGMYKEAIKLIKQDNPLPAICGRVCVRPCEAACRRNLMEEGSGVGIDYLKRFAADKDLNSEQHYKPEIAVSTGKKVAIIGGGPGGLSAAYWLAQKGHQADIFEAMPHAGGWLRYGIPEYRLPNDLVEREIATITELGVNIFTNQKLGENFSYKEISEKYDASILTIGSQKGTSVGCEGDDAENVFSGIDFLRNMEVSGQKYDFRGKKVAVVGGGNTAMDCCRTSIRCEADEVYVIYRRTEAEMPANPIEIHESKLEGVKYLFLTAPVLINKQEDGTIKSIRCIKMELGEPDASGRRRPVPVENSEFELEIDFLLAAIGQKTDINFIDDINQYSKNGTLKINKWGDIDADKFTLQTGIPGVFAAGDGVTGPATAIEAIAQAKIAVHSCDQYLKNEEIKSLPTEFFSRRDLFKKQISNEFTSSFEKQTREEMPVLEACARHNFNEVELGYAGEEVAKNETTRCLECGCTALNSCDLKRYATEYNADQSHFSGSFKEYHVDFSHPYIEIDNNKCILCGRCVRICREVVGASALGFVNRGFETFIAPSMGSSLTETTCESCGMCISTCPTGALTENKSFKPGPVKTEIFKTICNYCSVGCELKIHHKSNFVMEVTGSNGTVNKDGNICRMARFGYNYINDLQRIKTPLLKSNGKFSPISWENAFDLIFKQISQVKPDENAFFAGARLSNEELYLIQKLARAGVKCNNVGSFHYLERGKGYHHASESNVPFHEIKGASRIYLIGSIPNIENPVAGFFVHNAQYLHKIPVVQITTLPSTPIDHKIEETLRIKAYYPFIKAINHYLLSNGKENAFYIKGNTQEFEIYKSRLLRENFEELLSTCGVTRENLIEFAEIFNNEQNAVILFAEKAISGNCALEIRNLAMLTGKLGKTSSGIIALKEKNNAQGMKDMGICQKMSPGNTPWNTERIALAKKIWQCTDIEVNGNFSLNEKVKNGEIKNLFIFGEDPLGCAINKTDANDLISNTQFKVVLDYFLTETAQEANLILPASLPFETGGSFTNTQKFIQTFDKVRNTPSEKDNIEILSTLNQHFELKTFANASEVMDEYTSFLSGLQNNENEFSITEKENDKRMFNFGCDNLVMRFAEEFQNAFKH